MYIIANTNYHFEITLSVYQALKDYGCHSSIYFCDKVIDKTKQIDFLNAHNIPITNNIDIYDKSIVISHYPDKIPNITDKIFRNNRIQHIFITHRVHKPSLNISKTKNIVCLSPIGMRHDLPFLIVNKYPFNLTAPQYNQTINLLVQGHFELNNRNMSHIENISNLLMNNDIRLHIVGTKIPKFLKLYKNTQIYSNVTESTLYNILNQTDYILPLIDPDIKNGEYTTTRFSSNFCHSFCMNKPVIAHKYFEDIYGLPGLYYEHNDQLFNIINHLHTKSNSPHYIYQFDNKRSAAISHNNKILKQFLIS